MADEGTLMRLRSQTVNGARNPFTVFFCADYEEKGQRMQTGVVNWVVSKDKFKSVDSKNLCNYLTFNIFKELL